MSIQIEEGKFYRTRAGGKKGPITLEDEAMGPHKWQCSTTKECWADNGAVNCYVDTPSSDDLVAEWDDYSRMNTHLDLSPGTMEMMHTRLASNDAPPIAPYVYTPPEPMRVQILHEGARLTNGERDAEYGPPAVNMAAAGALKAAFRAHITRDISLAELEAIDMALTKLGRIATGVKPKKDTFIDCATYIAIAGEIALAEWAVFIGEKKGPEA